MSVGLVQTGLNLHGWVYDIEKGVVEALDSASKQFVPLAEFPLACAT